MSISRLTRQLNLVDEKRRNSSNSVLLKMNSCFHIPLLVHFDSRQFVNVQVCQVCHQCFFLSTAPHNGTNCCFMNILLPTTCNNCVMKIVMYMLYREALRNVFALKAMADDHSVWFTVSLTAMPCHACRKTSSMIPRRKNGQYIHCTEPGGGPYEFRSTC